MHPNPDTTMTDHWLQHILLAVAAAYAGLIGLVNLDTPAGYALLAEMPPAETARVISHNVDLLRDSYLLTIIIVGSLAGGVLSFIVYPLPTPKAMAFKFLASGICGIAFCPIIAPLTARHLGVDLTGAWALAVSVSVSFTSWSLIQMVDPFVQRIALWWQRKTIGQLDEPPYHRPRSTRARDQDEGR